MIILEKSIGAVSKAGLCQKCPGLFRAQFWRLNFPLGVNKVTLLYNTPILKYSDIVKSTAPVASHLYTIDIQCGPGMA